MSERSKSEGKQPYSTPRLTVYGDLREVTLVKGGTKGDVGPVPSTRLD